MNPGLGFLVGDLPVVIALWHFVAWAGWRMAWLSFAVIYVVAHTSEFIGTHTGLVFGNYFYSPMAIGPLLAKVPVLLPLGYFAMGYGACIVTRLMLRNLNQALSWVGVVVTAFPFFLIITILLNRASALERRSEPQPRNFYAQGIVLYATYGIAIVLNPLLGRTGEIYDAMAMVAGLVITMPIIVAAVSVRESPDHSP